MDEKEGRKYQPGEMCQRPTWGRTSGKEGMQHLRRSQLLTVLAQEWKGGKEEKEREDGGRG